MLLLEQLVSNCQLYKFEYIKHNGDAFFHIGNIQHIDGSVVFKVFCTTVVALTDPSSTGEIKLLFGYKDGSGECDVGYIYAPYVPVISYGPVSDNVTHKSLMTYTTRYGKWTRWKNVETELGANTTPSYVGQSSDYYSILTIPSTFSL